MFVLEGKDDGYLGITCTDVDCLKNIVFHGKIEHVQGLKDTMFYSQPLRESSYGFLFEYFSGTAFDINLIKENSHLHVPSFTCLLKMDIGFNEYSEQLNEFIDTYNLSNSKYYTTVNLDNYIKTNGIITIGWMTKENIEECISIENNSKIKLIPRYIVNDHLHDLVRKFLHNYFVGKYDIKDPLSSEKYSFNAKNVNIHKEIIHKHIDFINMLSCRPVEIGISYKDSNCSSLIKTIDFIFHKKLKYPDYDYIGNNIWENIHKEYMQEILSNIDYAFIQDYIKLTRRTDFSFFKLWELKDKYLIDIFDSIESRHKREQVKEQSKKAELAEVEELEKKYPCLAKICSKNPAMNKLKKEIVLCAKAENAQNILIQGENGTGKELVAAAIHEIAKVAKPLATINVTACPGTLFDSKCFGHKKGAFTGAIKDQIGIFKLAENGMVFLDEIGDLDKSSQPNLLRAVQLNREIQPLGGKPESISLRMLFGTNRDLHAMVKTGEFRQDLYFRIAAFPLRVPPLRERKDDIELLLRHLIDKYDNELSDSKKLSDQPEIEPLLISQDCIEHLQRYDWPGNIRELENIAMRVATNHQGNRDEISIADFPDDVFFDAPNIESSVQLPEHRRFADLDDEVILDCLKRHKNNKTKAGKEFGVTYRTMLRRCKDISEKL
jgi:transcriptional regulator with PAS, ATPase and Fis domain